MMQAVERGEQNFVTKLIHDQHLSWGLYYMSKPNGYPQPGPRGHNRSKSGGRITIEYKKVVTRQALERSEQNFVTKLYHVPHLAWGLFCMYMPNGLPPARSHG